MTKEKSIDLADPRVVSRILPWEAFERQLSLYPQSITPFIDTMGLTEEGDPIQTDDIFTLAAEAEAEAVEGFLLSV